MIRGGIPFLSFTLMAFFTLGTAYATSRPSDYISENAYNNLYPYMNNTMRTSLNPGTNPTQSNAQINVLARTKSTNTSTRNVVPRRGTATTSATARAATTPSGTGGTRRVATRTVSARSAGTPNNTARTATNAPSGRTYTTTRNVVARAATTGNNTNMRGTATRTTRGDGNVSTVRQSTSPVYTTTETAVSSARCMADYVDCMNDYCERADTEYNRCYCSSKLAQIDSQYKPEIDRLIKEILTLKSENYWTDAEMDEYWMEMIGQYTGDNSWHNLDEALNIDWSGTESTVRGQQAFAIGHQYCVQHLSGCAYMQTNMRDAYRSEISRDCAAYETSLQRLKNAAESIVEAYK